jgi:NADH:ubiquinone oxidoreductase subunit 5 (subunit L)/multisubunit Na+/H+ antiporter MnhA subunit
MYISVVILPLLSAIISGFLVDYSGQKGVIFLANFFMFFSCFLAWFIFYEVNLCGTTVSIYLWEWFSSDKLIVHWSFYLML